MSKFLDEWKWFCGRINFGASFLDARAIRFMNEFNFMLDQEVKERIKELD